MALLAVALSIARTQFIDAFSATTALNQALQIFYDTMLRYLVDADGRARPARDPRGLLRVVRRALPTGHVVARPRGAGHQLAGGAIGRWEPMQTFGELVTRGRTWIRGAVIFLVILGFMIRAHATWELVARGVPHRHRALARGRRAWPRRPASEPRPRHEDGKPSRTRPGRCLTDAPVPASAPAATRAARLSHPDRRSEKPPAPAARAAARHGFRRLLTVRVVGQLSDGCFQAGLASYVFFSPGAPDVAPSGSRWPSP